MRPASVKSSASPFVRKTEKSGKPLEINWDIVEPSYNHNYNRDLFLRSIKRLRKELQWAEEDGRESKAKKLRREINRAQENLLAIPAPWCSGCLNYLHNCQCEAMEEVDTEKTILDLCRRIVS